MPKSSDDNFNPYDLRNLGRLLSDLEKVLILLTNICEKQVPAVDEDVSKIINNIKNGFNTSILTSQAEQSINEAIQKADFTKIFEEMDNLRKKVSTALYDLREETTNYIFKQKFILSALSMIIGICFGSIISYYIAGRAFNNNVLTAIQNIEICKVHNVEINPATISKNHKH